jgi:hypothetical protein
MEKKDLAYKMLFEFEISTNAYAENLKRNDVDGLYWLGRQSMVRSMAYSIFGEKIGGLPDSDFMQSLRDICRS